MKRCLEICSIASEFPGSFVKNMQALIERAEKEQIKIEFVFPPQAQEHLWCKQLSQKTKVHFVEASKAALNPKTYAQLGKILRKGNYDIVHCHYESYDIPTKVLKSFYHLRFRLICHLHCNPVACLEIYSPLKQIYYKIMYKYFTVGNELIAINKNDADVIAKFAKKATVHTILNGIDINDLKQKELANFSCTFMMHGWEFYRKGVDLVIEACKFLHEKGYTFKTVINGNENTKKLIDEYLNGVLYDFLEFQEPQYNRNDFFDLSPVFIMASRSETFNYGIAEASYLGKHIITSDIHGVSWSFCLPNVHTFKSESVQELANLMEEYLLKGNEWEFDKQAVSNYIADRYSDSAWSKALIELYNE